MNSLQTLLRLDGGLAIGVIRDRVKSSVQMKLNVGVSLACLMLAAAPPIRAHHSFAAGS